jgi:hypothetical protein
MKYVILFVCISGIFVGCITSKVKSFPKHVGHQHEEKIVLMGIESASEFDAESLRLRGSSQVKQELLSIRVVDYWDLETLLRQHGLTFPAFDNPHAELFKQLHNVSGIRYAFTTKLDKAVTLPYDHNHHSVLLRGILIDLKTGGAVWHCSTTVSIAPLKVNDQNGGTEYNPLGLQAAVNKAYIKSVKKLIKALDYYYPPND